MEIYKVIILGIVQGLTEFLPISSSGHIALVSNLLDIEESLFLSVILHLATLIPIIVTFKKEIVEYIFDFKKLKFLIIASLPAGVVGLFFNGVVESTFNSISFLSWSFFTTALMLIFSRFAVKDKYLPLNNKRAFTIGLFQAVAIFPGISRSGSCLVAGRISGVNREDLLPFAFIMSVPIILCSTALETAKIIFTKATLSVPFSSLVLGFASALVVGFLSLRLMKKLSKNSFIVFGVYLILLSIIIRIWI